MTITVYGASLSPYARKVLVYLTEKNIPYELEQINPFDAPDWFSSISPMGKIPVIRDTSAGPDATVPDSSVICAYLERKYPEPALLPKDDFAMARAIWFEEYSDTALGPGAVGGPFFYALVVRRLMGQPADLATVENTLKNKIPPIFSYLDKELSGQDYFVGGHITIADIAIASQLANFKHAGGVIDDTAFANLSAFADRMHKRPSFQRFLAAETALLQGALEASGPAK